jgi:environmental stress-induced protein Ves
MAIVIHHSDTFTTTNWSGGKTTQLFSYPKGSTVEARDFVFRISTASVEVEESDFTRFDGYNRKLMVLTGELFIQHKDQYSLLMKPFDQDLFSGDWTTNTKGKVQDFNVIYKPELEIKLAHHDIEARSYITFHQADASYVYVLGGKGEVKGLSFSEGDLIELKNEVLTSVHASSALTLIAVEVKNHV